MMEDTKDIQTPEKNSGDMHPEEVTLKSIRESRGMTLKDVFQHTRISVSNLEAIENAHYHLLPPPVFTKSFMRTYAKFLNIDEKKIIAPYDRYIGSLQTKPLDTDIKKKPAFSRTYYRIFAGVLFILIVISLVTFSLSSYQASVDAVKNQIIQSPPPAVEMKPSPVPETKPEIKMDTSTMTSTAPPTKETQPSVPAKETQTSSPGAQTTDISQSTRAPGETKPEESPPLSNELIMEARELTWLRITTDNGTPYEVLLRPGEKIKKTGTQFTIDVGNAGGIDIRFRGKSLGTLGKHGQVVHLKLPLR